MAHVAFGRCRPPGCILQRARMCDSLRLCQLTPACYDALSTQERALRCAPGGGVASAAHGGSDHQPGAWRHRQAPCRGSVFQNAVLVYQCVAVAITSLARVTLCWPVLSLSCRVYGFIAPGGAFRRRKACPAAKTHACAAALVVLRRSTSEDQLAAAHPALRRRWSAGGTATARTTCTLFFCRDS